MSETNNKKSRGRWTLLGLAVLFMGPLLIAWIWYFSGGEIASEAGTINKGELISPARPLSQVAFPMLDGTANVPFPRGKWTLMLVNADGCQASCRSALVNMRQVNLALGKDADRVRRALLATRGEPDVAAIQKEHKGLLLIRATGGAAPIFFKPFPRDPSGDVDSSRIYLSDPLGNLMMSYPADGEPRNMLDDIEKLLRLSRIG